MSCYFGHSKVFCGARIFWSLKSTLSGFLVTQKGHAMYQDVLVTQRYAWSPKRAAPRYSLVSREDPLAL